MNLNFFTLAVLRLSNCEMNILFTFVTVERQCPYLAKIKVKCKLMRVERDNLVLRMLQREGTCKN